MIPYSKQSVIDKWKQVGMLNSQTSASLYNELDDLVNDKPFTNFPIIQRVSAMTIGQQLVSVQPMSPPTGVINYLDYKYRVTNLYDEIIKLSYGF
jgi:hypothetical protein